MYMTPTEEDRVRLFAAAELARRTRAQGVRLSAPEAVAIMADEMHAAARRGASYDEVVEAGRAAVRAEDVLDGVPDLVPELRVEVILDEGSRLVVLRRPLHR